MGFDGSEDVLGYWGRNVVEDYHNTLLKKLPSLTAQLSGVKGGNKPPQQPFRLLGSNLRVGQSPPQLPRLPYDGHDHDGQAPPQLPGHRSGRRAAPKVGILGAGVGGLYTALMLDSLDIKYEILEASDRTGGRLFTHKFEDGGKYDYYDVGAMRYPLPKKDENGKYKSGVMKRLGELIEYSKLNDGLAVPLRDTIIDYYYQARTGGTFKYFNSERYQVPLENPDPPNFRAREMGVESEYITAGVDNIAADIVIPFARMIMEDVGLDTNMGKGWDLMMQNDAYSLRAYMSFKYIPSVDLKLPPSHLNTNTINWCETFDKSTGWYDRALTEQVLEALAFARVGSSTFGEIEWKCFDGGSHVLADYMTKYIRSTTEDPNALIRTNKSVKSISQATNGMEVSTWDGSATTYSHVISTIPLPCMRTIDLSAAGLNVMQTTALRKLQYGPSVKVGIRFKTTWWTTRFGIVGGQSFTDLPVRTVVYPSYGVDSDTPSTVLIASYCWTNDAERLGSLISTGKEEYNEQLKELVLRNLADVHGMPYSDLVDEFVEMHAWDWNHDPLTGGAFAFFGPGDFQDLYTSLTAPNANKRLHFAGEAISTRHAWVVGALDSAWRAVFEYLLSSGQHDRIEEFFRLWGTNVEWAQLPTEPPTEDGSGGFDPEDHLLGVHMRYTYAAELTGDIKF
ncbi:hypothetical protein K503DRAFT_436190 [Rhizopogon vinicolor AM-OR11-026]|uniref:Amine oxidase domain-containing protein n=1 Tax=Rhizopogon vinicolor AM-OR11-026 TaxID=1314800 RepID=A0A1B7NAQ0_9AGAM|nr:hypothetical protein K503DRAFT_436190 [Rhizopogon vinicolor AM-OR11-026]